MEEDLSDPLLRHLLTPLIKIFIRGFGVTRAEFVVSDLEGDATARLGHIL